MKKDNLENFIKQNQLDLDIETPDDDVIWEGIRSGMLKKKKPSFKPMIWAAILLPLIGLSVYMTYSYNSNLPPANSIEIENKSLSTIGPKWAALEVNYQNDIQTKWTSIEQQNYDAEEFNFLFEELGILDEVNAEYKQHIDQIENERLIETLIDYYEKKTRILEKILNEIERKKQNKYENRSIEL